MDLNVLNSTEQQIWSCLKKARGADNAVTSREVASWLGINQRTVRATVRSLREKGLPIASGSSDIRGYFIPESAEEADICRRHLESRVRKIAKIVRALDRSFPREDGQETLFKEAGSR